MKKYDLIVLGGGSAGLTAAAGGAGLGAKVALVEKAEQPGGDCLHFGCIPSKALIAAAKSVHQAKVSAAEFGFTLEGEADFLQAIRRVKAAQADIQKHDDADRFRAMGVDVYQGFGRLIDDHQIEIAGGETIYGKRILISTGSSPIIPPIEGLLETGFITNETVFDLQAQPKRLIVVGGGPIGLELAQCFARFGTEVTVLEFAPGLFAREEQELVPYIQEALEQELQILVNTKMVKAEKLPSGEKQVTMMTGDAQRVLIADEILMATGRKPNTTNIGLEAAGVKTERGYVVVDRTLRTSVSHIFAAGDVLQAFPFTHAAGMEGKVVVGNAVFGLRRKVSYDHVPWVTYTDPEVFHLGMTEQEARAKHGDDISVYAVTLDDVDRFVADRATNGMVKLIADAKGRTIGAHAVGKDAGDWMQEIIYAKTHGHKVGQLSNVIHPYPTHGAALQRAADQYWRKKLFSGMLPKLMKKYIQWFR